MIYCKLTDEDLSLFKLIINVKKQLHLIHRATLVLSWGPRMISNWIKSDNEASSQNEAPIRLNSTSIIT